MRSARRLTAFVSGLLLYCTAIAVSWTLLDGWLQHAVRPYFRSYADTLMATAGCVALLIFALSLGWSFLTVRVPPGSRRPATAWCLAGIGTAGMGWLMAGVFSLATVRRDTALTVIDMLLLPSTPPLWGPLNTAAVLAGTLLAGMLARRYAPPSRRGRPALQPTSN